MKTQILSDIHLEFGLREFDFSQSDLIILAGDIHLGKNGVDWISEKISNKQVIYVLGNHEYYKNSYPKLINTLRDITKGTNIHLLENDSICIDGVTFHGSTLWTDFELFGDPGIAGFECQQKMNDYHLIRRDPSYSRLRSIDTRVIHIESLKWLKHSLRNSKTKTNVVITHHAPSCKSIAEKYKNDLISAGFASNLESVINELKPNLWIHGHIHEFYDYTIGQTRVICNPKGYPGEKIEGYQEKFIVEICA